uniref:Disease resistance R13L4/SHOC-2-like LRR domain-containing protein n=1 Tax=Anopheles albimanus TaxID=7167 RepID=A0A182FFF9_ANOAL
WILLQPPSSSPFQLECTRDCICLLSNWEPRKEGTFVLDHIPEKYDFIMIQNMRATHVNSEIFEKFERRRLINASETTIEIKKSSIRSITFKDKSSFSSVILRDTLLRSIVFGVDSNLREFTVDHCPLEQLPSTLNNLKSLVHLEITRTQIQAVNLNTLGRLPKLEFLLLSSNRIHSLYYSADMELFPCLLYFYMQHNQLRSINFNLFNTMTSLTDINLRNNSLTTVSGALVSSSVNSVELTNNHLISLDCCGWRLPRLVRFDVTNNKLESLPRCLERTLTNASIIRLANNRLHLDEMERFRTFTQLEIIDLSLNMLSSVTLSKETLPPNLHMLNLSKNRLQSITMPYTSNSKRVTVDVSDNCISQFKLDDVPKEIYDLLMFRALVSNSLSSFLLTNNQLSSLDCCGWQLPRLHRFDVANNKLESLPRCLEQTLTNASMMLFANNRLHLDEMERFRSFTQLEVINLSQNILSSVTLSKETLPPNLYMLNLAKNRLQSFAVPYSPNAELRVDVSDNCIKSFDVKEVSKDLHQLLMFNNPIDCTLQYDVLAMFESNRSSNCVYTTATC